MRLLLAFLFLTAAISRADDFVQANQAYAAGKYATAIDGYRAVLRQHNHANAWFNLGNAHYRTDDLGHAALAYERALLAQPNHPEAAANLKSVRNKANARVEETPRLEKAWRYVAQPLASWLLIGEAWLGFALITAALIRRKSRAALVFGIILAFLGAGGIVALQFSRQELAKVAIAVVSVDARSEPADRATLVEALGPGSRVHVVSEQGDWIYCRLPSGAHGWIPASTSQVTEASGSTGSPAAAATPKKTLERIIASAPT